MEAISNFVRSKYLTSTTDGCGGGCQFWNGWGFPAESATIYIVSPYRRIFADLIFYICSLVYDLRIRSSGRIYELNAKVEKAD